MDNKHNHTRQTILIFVAIILSLLASITYLLFFLKDHRRTCRLDLEQGKRIRQISSRKPWTNSPSGPRQPQVEPLAQPDKAHVRQDGCGTGSSGRGAPDPSIIECTLQDNACRRMQSASRVVGEDCQKDSADTGLMFKQQQQQQQRLDGEDVIPVPRPPETLSPMRRLTNLGDEHVQAEYLSVLTMEYRRKNVARLPDELSDISEEGFV